MSFQVGLSYKTSYLSCPLKCMVLVLVTMASHGMSSAGVWNQVPKMKQRHHLETEFKTERKETVKNLIHKTKLFGRKTSYQSIHKSRKATLFYEANSPFFFL